MGDGAVNQGQVYEVFNIAALWKLPVLYIIENNGYSMGTSIARHAAGKHLYERGTAYGIPGEEVDGMDVLAVKAAAEKAVKYVRETSSPMILEVKTYRYRGHSMSDPAKYRTKEEVDNMRQNFDPIERAKVLLISEFSVSEEILSSLEKEIKEIVLEAVDFAQKSPEPEASELMTDILINS